MRICDFPLTYISKSGVEKIIYVDSSDYVRYVSGERDLNEAFGHYLDKETLEELKTYEKNKRKRKLMITSEILRFNKICHFYSLPNKIWKQAKGVFRKPICKFLFLNSENPESEYIKDFYSLSEDSFITISDFGWKTKYSDYRFEQVPFVSVKFFKWIFLWVWEAPIDDNGIYYETLMNYLWKYEKDIQRTYESFSWQKYDGNMWVSAWEDNMLIDEALEQLKR